MVEVRDTTKSLPDDSWQNSEIAFLVTPKPIDDNNSKPIRFSDCMEFIIAGTTSKVGACLFIMYVDNFILPETAK
jgi:hypothetical protein